MKSFLKEENINEEDMSYIPRNHDAQPWVSDNGLKVEKRNSSGFWLTWNNDPSQKFPSSVPPSATTSGEDCSAPGAAAVDHVGATDGLDGPWYHLQLRKFSDVFWNDVYKGYRNRIEIKDLQSDTTFYFRMRRNGQRKWGSEIIAATDSSPACADDIHRAVKSNADEMVLRIIASTKGAQLKRMLVSCDNMGMTPLMQACQNGSYLMANTLIKVGAWINATSHSSRKTALMHACISGNVKVVELLDAGNADWNKRDHSGSTALHHAITAGRLSVIKYIVNRLGVAVIEEKDGYGWTPLLRAIVVNCSNEITSYLLSKGANPNAVDKLHMKSCLISAVLGKRPDIVRDLLDHGVDIKFKNTLGKTAYEMCEDSKTRHLIRNRKEVAPAPRVKLT